MDPSSRSMKASTFLHPLLNGEKALQFELAKNVSSIIVSVVLILQSIMFKGENFGVVADFLFQEGLFKHSAGHCEDITTTNDIKCALIGKKVKT